LVPVDHFLLQCDGLLVAQPLVVVCVEVPSHIRLVDQRQALEGLPRFRRLDHKLEVVGASLIALNGEMGHVGAQLVALEFGED